jgi:hypothetical protein
MNNIGCLNHSIYAYFQGVLIYKIKHLLDKAACGVTANMSEGRNVVTSKEPFCCVRT